MMLPGNRQATRILRTLLVACLLVPAPGLKAQNKQTMEQATNPLLCDPAKGVCEIPGTDTVARQQGITGNKPVEIVYFTDPICSSCWGIEPQLRKMKLEYGADIRVSYHMGGLLPDWSYNSGGISKPSDVAHHWDEVSRYYDMPIDGDVWLEDPLPSSYPPSIAFKAAQLQDEYKAIAFLRRIREMVFLEKKNITKWEHLAQAALQTGLDTNRFKADYAQEAETLFKADLDLARKSGVRGFPTLLINGQTGKQEMLYGFRPYEAFEAALAKVHPGITKTLYVTSRESLFTHYPTLTTKEYAVLSNQTTEQSETQLEQAFRQGILDKVTTKNGPMWQRKDARQ